MLYAAAGIAPRVEGQGPRHRLIERGELGRVQGERREAVDPGLAPGEGPAVDRHQAREPARMAAGVANPDYPAQRLADQEELYGPQVVRSRSGAAAPA